MEEQDVLGLDDPAVSRFMQKSLNLAKQDGDFMARFNEFSSSHTSMQ